MQSQNRDWVQMGTRTRPRVIALAGAEPEPRGQWRGVAWKAGVGVMLCIMALSMYKSMDYLGANAAYVCLTRPSRTVFRVFRRRIRSFLPPQHKATPSDIRSTCFAVDVLSMSRR